MDTQLSPQAKNLVGKKFGRLTVISFAGKNGRLTWNCNCDCGKSLVVFGDNLKSGHSRSCGCLKTDDYCKTASRIIAAWGTHCPREHEEKVCEAIGRTIHCLGRSKSGRPKHPLYLRADTVPELFWEPAGRVAE